MTSTITPLGALLAAILLFALWPMPEPQPGDTPGVALVVLEPLAYGVLMAMATWLVGIGMGVASLVQREGRVRLAVTGLFANILFLAALLTLILKQISSV